MCNGRQAGERKGERVDRPFRHSEHVRVNRCRRCKDADFLGAPRFLAIVHDGTSVSRDKAAAFVAHREKYGRLPLTQVYKTYAGFCSQVLRDAAALEIGDSGLRSGNRHADLVSVLYRGRVRIRIRWIRSSASEW